MLVAVFAPLRLLRESPLVVAFASTLRASLFANASFKRLFKRQLWYAHDQWLSQRGIHRFCFLNTLHKCLFFNVAAWPDVKSSMILDGNLPGAPDPFPFPVTLIKDIVRAHIAFGPVTLTRLNGIPAFDQESPDI